MFWGWQRFEKGIRVSRKRPSHCQRSAIRDTGRYRLSGIRCHLWNIWSSTWSTRTFPVECASVQQLISIMLHFFVENSTAARQDCRSLVCCRGRTSPSSGGSYQIPIQFYWRSRGMRTRTEGFERSCISSSTIFQAVENGKISLWVLLNGQTV